VSQRLDDPEAQPADDQRLAVVDPEVDEGGGAEPLHDDRHADLSRELR
jgi:hypothetical protein